MGVGSKEGVYEGGHGASLEVDIKRRTYRSEASGHQRIATREANQELKREARGARAHRTSLRRRLLYTTYLRANINMLVWTVILLATGLAVDAAKPNPPPDITTLGSQKLATASDCSKPVAFSGSHADIQDAKLVLGETLLDQGVGYAASTGTFTTFCPGLYQFSFAGYGSSDLRMTLKRKLNKTDSWQPIASTGPHGGANTVLLRMALGDQVAIFVGSGKPDDNSTTFSGYRIARE